MPDRTDKRNYDRYDQEALITWAYFNSDNFRQAKMLNYGEGGLYFESHDAFQPGTYVHIRVGHKLSDNSGSTIHSGFRSVVLGEVKWCKEINGVEANHHGYGIGVKYYEPY